MEKSLFKKSLLKSPLKSAAKKSATKSSPQKSATKSSSQKSAVKNSSLGLSHVSKDNRPQMVDISKKKVGIRIYDVSQPMNQIGG